MLQEFINSEGVTDGVITFIYCSGFFLLYLFFSGIYHLTKAWKTVQRFERFVTGESSE